MAERWEGGVTQGSDETLTSGAVSALYGGQETALHDGGGAADTANPAPSACDETRLKGRVVLVAGPSGAGRSTAIAALEDLGYEAINNLPPRLLPRLTEGALERPLAVGIQARGRDFSPAELLEIIASLRMDPRLSVDLVFLDTSPEVLIRRYSETRRRHPFSLGAEPMDGIMQEYDLLLPVRAAADALVDTSALTPHELRAEMVRMFDTGRLAPMSIALYSFSYKRGLPRMLDTMFDCRFLANPHWVRELRPMTGLDPRVAQYVAADPAFAPFIARVTDLLLFLLPAHVAEGKTQFSVGFGCTGGQHRSVAVTEEIAKALAEAGWPVSKRHREIERQAAARPGTTGVIGA